MNTNIILLDIAPRLKWVCFAHESLSSAFISIHLTGVTYFQGSHIIIIVCGNSSRRIAVNRFTAQWNGWFSLEALNWMRQHWFEYVKGQSYEVSAFATSDLNEWKFHKKSNQLIFWFMRLLKLFYDYHVVHCRCGDIFGYCRLVFI